MNRGELRAAILDDLGEPSSPYWSAEDVNNAIQDALDDIAERTEWHEVVATVTIPPDSRYWDARNLLPTPLSFSRVFDVDRSRWLDRETYDSLDQRDREWDDTSGPAEAFLVRGMWHLGFWPRDPSQWTARIHYQGLPLELAADGNEPGFPDEFHRLVIDWSVYDLQLQRGKLDQALGSLAEYEKELLRFKDWVRKRNRAKNYRGPYSLRP